MAPPPETLTVIGGTGATGLLCPTQDGLLRFDGARWSRHPGICARGINALGALADGELLAVGSATAVLRLARP